MKNINKEILQLSLPSILANITVPLVGMVDTAVVGHLGGCTGAAALIGGIAIGTMLFDLLYWNFGFLRVSTGGLTAQAYGRWLSSEKPDGVNPECAGILSRSLLLAMLSAFFLISIQWVFVKIAFIFIQCSGEVRELAQDYFFIRIWAAPATLCLMAFKGWFIGMQDSISAMATDLVVNVFNITASIILARGIGEWTGLGYNGVAMGTVLAQYSGLSCAVGILVLKYRKTIVPAMIQSNLLRGKGIRRMLSMNRDIFIRSLCFIAVYIGYTVIAARYGDTLLAATSIMMKLLMIFSYFIDGFAYAGEAMTGRYIGENDTLRIRMSIKYNFIWCGILAVAFMFIYGLGGEFMLRIMTDDPEVIRTGVEFIPWLMLMPFVGCGAFAWDGIFIGATETSQMRNAMLLSVASFFAVWFGGYAITGPDSPAETRIHVLFAAYFAHLLARTVWLTLRFRMKPFYKRQ